MSSINGQFIIKCQARQMSRSTLQLRILRSFNLSDQKDWSLPKCIVTAGRPVKYFNIHTTQAANTWIRRRLIVTCFMWFSISTIVVNYISAHPDCSKLSSNGIYSFVYWTILMLPRVLSTCHICNFLVRNPLSTLIFIKEISNFLILAVNIMKFVCHIRISDGPVICVMYKPQ